MRKLKLDWLPLLLLHFVVIQARKVKICENFLRNSFRCSNYDECNLGKCDTMVTVTNYGHDACSITRQRRLMSA